MSSKHVADVFDRSQARGMARLVLLVMAHLATDEGIAWPSNAALRELTGLSYNGVRRGISTLTDMGEVEVQKVGGGRGVATRYRITLNG